jgi:excisionase family DNA binding protein
MANLTEYLKTAEAAAYLGVHENTIRNWAERGLIKMHRNPANGYRLFRQDELDMFLKAVAKPTTTTRNKPK